MEGSSEILMDLNYRLSTQQLNSWIEELSKNSQVDKSACYVFALLVLLLSFCQVRSMYKYYLKQRLHIQLHLVWLPWQGLWALPTQYQESLSFWPLHIYIRYSVFQHDAQYLSCRILYTMYKNIINIKFIYRKNSLQ